MAHRLTRRFMLAAAAGAPLAAVAGVSGETRSFAARYALHVGGLRTAEAALSVRRRRAHYEAAATLRAVGLADWVFDIEAEAAAEGRLAGAAPEPERFAAEAWFGGERHSIGMAYGPTLDVTAEPPLRARDYDAGPETLNGALDPLSAAVAACLPVPEAAAGDRTLALYDGRRRIDMRVGPTRVERGRLRAEAELVRVAGFKASRLARAPIPLTLWWDRKDGMAELARAQGATPLGAAVVTRRG